MTRPGSRSVRLTLAVLVVLLSGMRAQAAQAAGGAPAAKTTTIKSIQIDRSGEVWIVKIEADGPLPAPTIGEVDAPARVFLDFAGVRTKTNGAPGVTGAPVVRVRAAVNSASPLITRVVIDLRARQPIRTEAEQMAAGRFSVLFGEVADSPSAQASSAKASTPAKASTFAKAPVDKPVDRPPEIPLVGPLPSPKPDAPPPGTPSSPPTSVAPATAATISPPAASPSPARSAPPPVPAKDAERYKEQITATLNRYRKLQPALVSIDRQDPKPAEDLTIVREESAAVLRALTAYRPSDAVRPTHDLLVRSASFALMAATLRIDAGTRADPEKMRNAASAAAGALLLLDRVCTELGCSPN